MFKQLRWPALLAVAVLISGCTSRTILHGMRGYRHLPQKPPVAATPVSKDLSVWFVKAQTSGLKVVPVTRKLLGGDKIEQAVKELLDGPTNSEAGTGLGTEIPRGTILIAVQRAGKNVELNLSRRFALEGGTDSIETRIEQLRRTVAPVAGDANVYLSVEGKRLNITEGEGIEIHQPINR